MRDLRIHRAARRELHVERLEGRALLAVSVPLLAETAAAPGADDVAIWIHPTDVTQSVIIGAVKTSSTSLRVYNLAGQQIQSVAVPQINNVDLRYNFQLSGQRIALLAGSNRATDSIAVYQIDSHGVLHDIAARAISTGMEIYGCAMYFSVATGKYYTFVSSETGQVQQWELFDNGAGKVDARLVRSFSVGSIAEGMVADDVLGTLYVGEENRGIWRYAAEPSGGAMRTSVDTIGSGGRLSADVEGLTIYYKPGGAGYLIASSQGSSEFAVYRREGSNTYIGNFKLIAGNGVDAVSDTDGIDVTNLSLGPQFPAGMLVAQDSDENFKLARWDAIDAVFGELISGDGTWDPRQVGSPAGSSSYLKQWQADFGTSLRSDLTGDGLADGADFLFWQRSFAALGAASKAVAAPAATTFAADTQPAADFAASRPGETVADRPPEQAVFLDRAQRIGKQSPAIFAGSPGTRPSWTRPTTFTDAVGSRKPRAESLFVNTHLQLRKTQGYIDRIRTVVVGQLRGRGELRRAPAKVPDLLGVLPEYAPDRADLPLSDEDAVVEAQASLETDEPRLYLPE